MCSSTQRSFSAQVGTGRSWESPDLIHAAHQTFHGRDEIERAHILCKQPINLFAPLGILWEP